MIKLKDFTRYIPYGRRNAISKAELCRLSGLNERSIRDRIKKANTELARTGFVIISSSQLSGYWLTDDPYEIYMYLREAERRAMKIREHNEPVYKLFRQLSCQQINRERSHPYY